MFLFVADWHALTTHYDDPRGDPEGTWDMVIDWLAAGVDPGEATLFIQSQVPEHAELHLLLSMITARLAGARADLGRISRKTEGRTRTCRPTASLAIRCFSPPTSWCIAPTRCRWARTRWCTSS